MLYLLKKIWVSLFKNNYFTSDFWVKLTLNIKHFLFVRYNIKSFDNKYDDKAGKICGSSMHYCAKISKLKNVIYKYFKS